EFSEGDVCAQFLAGFDSDAQLCDHRDFRHSYFHRFAQADDAISREAACQVALFKKRDAVPSLWQFPRTGTTGRSGADDGDFLASCFRGLEQIQSVSISEVHGIAL